jgi:hypothetical protein
MVFYYKSTSTDYDNSGSIAIAVNYNANEAPYDSMGEVLNSMFAVSSKPSIGFAAPLECDPKTQPQGGFHVRHADNIIHVSDMRFSTVGLLNIATSGLTLPAGTTIGQLWVSYDIELMFPYTSATTPITTYGPTAGTWSSSNNGVDQLNSNLQDSFGPGISFYQDATNAFQQVKIIGRKDLVGKQFRIYASRTNAIYAIAPGTYSEYGFAMDTIEDRDDSEGAEVNWLTRKMIMTITNENVLTPPVFNLKWSASTGGIDMVVLAIV